MTRHRNLPVFELSVAERARSRIRPLVDFRLTRQIFDRQHIVIYVDDVNLYNEINRDIVLRRIGTSRAHPECVRTEMVKSPRSLFRFTRAPREGNDAAAAGTTRESRGGRFGRASTKRAWQKRSTRLCSTRSSELDRAVQPRPRGCRQQRPHDAPEPVPEHRTCARRAPFLRTHRVIVSHLVNIAYYVLTMTHLQR